jgi:hypothetical protein
MPHIAVVLLAAVSLLITKLYSISINGLKKGKHQN